ncbi:hypothetical protein JZ751_027144 [Albula glossodonta]|uniref:rRNA biogenesis protein RRP36 n=1 Tax=Albula glossodonta TaxID=121402 RepID=A0A8T2NKF1_9TELE|nr:hypothetical protein JZ751_027144 [Albula glossodonta]
MASKEKQGILKRKSTQKSPDGMGTKKRGVTTRLEQLDPLTSDEDSDQEMEKNFALFSKQSLSRSTGKEDESDAEDDDCDRSSNGSEAVEEARASTDSDGDDDNAEENETVNIKGDAKSDDNSDEDAESDGDSDEFEDAGDSSDITEEEAMGCDVKNDRKMQSEEDIKRELSTMSFEDIMTLQNKVGMKAYNEVAYGTTSKEAQEKKKRLNRNRPMEISAKKRVPFLRQVVPVKKPVLRDPRFDDLSGEYKPEIFEKTYSFIHDIKKKEKKVVEKRLRKAKTAKKKEQLEMLLKRMVNQEKAHERQQQQREKELELKRKQREMVGQGQRPFFLKKSEQRKLELADRYSELKKSGKLENFLSKKRKRNAAKDRRKLPSHHKLQ